MNEDNIDEVRAVLSRVRARSNNRRLALKQLHKAHQLTLSFLHNEQERNDFTVKTLVELQQENQRLRTELANRPRPVTEHNKWWNFLSKKKEDDQWGFTNGRTKWIKTNVRLHNRSW